jgi:hypothetical protein
MKDDTKPTLKTLRRCYALAHHPIGSSTAFNATIRSLVIVAKATITVGIALPLKAH